jgi:hypothetical protein
MKIVTGVLAVIAAVAIATGTAAAQGPYASGTTGTDVSWPNCSSSVPKTFFGIVGVTGGKGFSPNSCFKSEAAKFIAPTLYVNTGYPGQSYGLKYQNAPKTCLTTDLNCLAYNYGYNAGQYAANFSQSQGVTSPTWWLDVETMNTWTKDTNQNRNSLQGETDALRDAGVTTTGVYSTTAQWGTITGGWQNGAPGWGASTWTTAKQAAAYCSGHQFTGGPTYLIQFLPRHSLDQDYAC